MLSNDVRLHRRVLKFLDGISSDLKDTILSRIEELSDFPRIRHLKSVSRLRGSHDLWFRMRLGDLRIVFRWDKEHRVVFVEKADWRGKVYK